MSVAIIRNLGSENNVPTMLDILENTPLEYWGLNGTLSTNITNNNPLTWTNSTPNGDSIQNKRIQTTKAYNISKYKSMVLTLSIGIATYYANAYPGSIDIVAVGEKTNTEYKLKTHIFSNNHNIQRWTTNDERVNIETLNLPTTERYYIGLVISNWYTIATTQNQSISVLKFVK